MADAERTARNSLSALWRRARQPDSPLHVRIIVNLLGFGLPMGVLDAVPAFKSLPRAGLMPVAMAGLVLARIAITSLLMATTFTALEIPFTDLLKRWRKPRQ